MSKFPKKIERDSWVTEDRFTWDSTHKFFYIKNNTSKWSREKRVLSSLKKLYDDIYTNVVFVISDTTIPYIFDFVIPDEKLVIEYNGEEHYHFMPEFYETPALFLDKVRRDFSKILFSNEIGYKYLPVSYDQNITVDGLKYYIDNYAGDIEYILNHYDEHYERFD